MNHRLFYNTEHLIEMYMDTDKEVQRIKRQKKIRHKSFVKSCYCYRAKLITVPHYELMRNFTSMSSFKHRI